MDNFLDELRQRTEEAVAKKLAEAVERSNPERLIKEKTDADARTKAEEKDIPAIKKLMLQTAGTRLLHYTVNENAWDNDGTFARCERIVNEFKGMGLRAIYYCRANDRDSPSTSSTSWWVEITW